LRTHDDNSLRAQDPDSIIAALHYYAQKILREDSDMGRLMLRRGLGWFYYYYASALLTIPEWKDKGTRLLRTACSYWPPCAVRYISKRLYFMFIRRYRKIFPETQHAA
jgi:hypothetical protein